MANTTNFGWETPDDTDLVKDGAAAMRTLGNAIDTSFVDLKGGTTGQILSKASNTDLDYTWITNEVGDITAITAGTGLSGGGTSGDVTLTNTVATTFDAKGDLVVGTGADAFSRIAVGTNGQVLTADSTAGTGLKWASPNGPTAGFQRGTSDQTLTANTWVKLQMNSENWDTDNCYDPTTNYRFTANKAGYYQINALPFLGGTSTSYDVAVYLNGAFQYLIISGHATGGLKNGPIIMYLNGTTDYIEFYAYCGTNNGSLVNRSGGSPTTIAWLRS